jgi:predicted nucleic acid-binding Zn ribbon protein
MSMYVYQVIEADGSEGEIFEVLQSMSEPALTKHPETGQPVRRLLGLPNVAGKNSDMKIKSNLSASNLERHGFTQYKKSGKGTYEKTAGDGPNVISKGDA